MKIFSRQLNHQWLLLGLAWLVALVLGVFGFASYAEGHNLGYSVWDDLYLSIQLIPMNSGGLEPAIPLSLNIARFMMPLLAGATAVKALWDVFRQQIRMTRLGQLRNHIIICGLSRKGLLLANQFRQQGEQIVIIEHDEENDWLESCREQGMYVLLGDASDPTLLRTAGVEFARGLFAVCDDDGLNTEIALRAQELVQDRKTEPLLCLAHVSDPQLCILLREQEATLERAPFRLELFNVFERGARRMLQEFPAWHDGQDPASPVPHILIVGLGRMGESLLLHAARDWWNRHPDKAHRLQVTIVDRRAVRKVESIQVRYPQLAKACSLTSLDMEIHSSEFERAGFLSNQEKSCPDAIYVCVDSDSLGLHAGLVLRRRIPDCSTPIVVRMTEETGLARLLVGRKNNKPGSYRNLYGFGYLNYTCTPDLLTSTLRDQLARAAHEEYAAAQLRARNAASSDPALKPWDQLDEQYQRANYQWVDHINGLLKEANCSIVPLNDWDAPAFEFSLEEVNHLAHLEHDLWRQDKQADGWRYSAGEKNLAARTSPDLVEWEKLDEREKEKNRLFISEIPAFLSRAGYQVVRKSVEN